jgi:CHAT domain-containing protein
MRRLPYSGTESTFIKEVFAANGAAADQLLQATATEDHLRGAIAGRRIIHLACHGLADMSYGNLFGCLALTPGPPGVVNPNDDGFLTLAEIYQLDLRGSELAILSACQTNYGPRQRGEALWALTRGFLVAGSRRVISTNWLVDDAAGASLMSYACGGIAQAEKGGGTANYAAALQAAKRWVRANPDHPEWKSPYYWAPFVLVGPN